MSSLPWAAESIVQRADVDCDVNIGGTGLAVVWVMTSLAMMVVGVRLYGQARITKLFGLSDWLMLASILTIIGFASLISVQYHYGWGRHQACITDLARLETQIKYNFAGQPFGIMGSTFGRLSFIVFMTSLFGSRNWVRHTLWVIFGAQIVTNVVTVAMIYAQCKDPRALYIFTLPQDQCWPAYVQTYLGWAHTSFNGACDLFLSVLPAVMVWNLHMPTRLKVGVAILLGMSALGLVGLVMKCVYLNALSYEGDYSYNTVPMFTWIMVEGCLVAIAASAPVLRPMFRHTFPSRVGTTDPNSYDLPRYAARSGQTDSSGFTRLGSKARTSVRVGTTNSSRLSGVPRYPGMTALDPGSSEEDIILCLQHHEQQQQQQQQQRQQETQQQNLQRRQSDLSVPTGGIVVKQEYTVTSEVMEKGWEDRESTEIGLTIQTKELGRVASLTESSPGSEAKDMPQSPASVYRRANP